MNEHEKELMEKYAALIGDLDIETMTIKQDGQEPIKLKEKEPVKIIAGILLGLWVNAKTVNARDDYYNKLEQVINYYTTISKGECYKAAKESGSPMHYAVKTFFFPAIKIGKSEDKETHIVTYSIDEFEKPIDLGDMHKQLGGIGHDTNWIYTVEQLNYYLTIRAAERVGATVKIESFRMNDIARERSLGKNPCSNTNMLKTLQLIVTEMLGEGYKATSHDVNYLIDVYANDNKKSKTSITAANHKTLRNYLKKVCYRVLTNGTGYDVDQKEIKA